MKIANKTREEDAVQISARGEEGELGEDGKKWKTFLKRRNRNCVTLFSPEGRTQKEGEAIQENK